MSFSSWCGEQKATFDQIQNDKKIDIISWLEHFKQRWKQKVTADEGGEVLGFGGMWERLMGPMRRPWMECLGG